MIEPRRSPAPTAARLLLELAAFAALLFATRFLTRPHLLMRTDEMCHIGAIGVEVLEHGIRFPLLAYAPNAHDNGSFFGGLLAALSFALLGRNVLALKLVTHLFMAVAAVASLWLLRGCLDELGLTGRRIRWTATASLVIAIALAPRFVTIASMVTVGLGSPTEGAAINTILLALFAHRAAERGRARTAVLWMCLGLVLYVNKGTALVIPPLAAVEMALAWRLPSRLAAAAAGFVVGILPHLLPQGEPQSLGWSLVLAKMTSNVRAFPGSLVGSVMVLADERVELIVAWALGLAVGLALLMRGLRGASSGGMAGGAPGPSRTAPVTLALVTGVTALHLAALTLMAQGGGMDQYTLYGYPTLAVLVAVLVGWACARAGARWGERAGRWSAAVAIAALLVVHRPDSVHSGFATVARLWRDRGGAACSWHLAEGFGREYEDGFGLPGRTRDEHMIERCHSLAGEDQVLDCIGGIARTMPGFMGKVDGEPPPALTPAERRAYAFYWGTHRSGDASACHHFTSATLETECAAAVQLECLVFGDISTRWSTGRGLARPRCNLPEVPMGGYWASARQELLESESDNQPRLAAALGRDGITDCQAVFDACYPQGRDQ